MHIFEDASLDIFEAAVFLKPSDPDGFIELAFVLGRARVTPIKSWTIPKLELPAAVLATRLKVQVQNSSATT